MSLKVTTYLVVSQKEKKVKLLIHVRLFVTPWSLPGSSGLGIFQALVLDGWGWAVAISFSKGSSRPRDWTQVSHIVEDALPSEPPGSLT